MGRKIKALYIDGTFSGIPTCVQEIRKFLKEEKKIELLGNPEDFKLQQDSVFSTIYSQMSSGTTSFRSVIENNSITINKEKHFNSNKGSAFIIIIPYKRRNGQYDAHELAWQVTELTELIGLDFNVIEVIPGESILDISQKIKDIIDSKYQF